MEAVYTHIIGAQCFPEGSVLTPKHHPNHPFFPISAHHSLLQLLRPQAPVAQLILTLFFFLLFLPCTFLFLCVVIYLFISCCQLFISRPLNKKVGLLKKLEASRCIYSLLFLSFFFFLNNKLNLHWVTGVKFLCVGISRCLDPGGQSEGLDDRTYDLYLWTFDFLRSCLHVAELSEVMFLPP